MFNFCLLFTQQRLFFNLFRLDIGFYRLKLRIFFIAFNLLIYETISPFSKIQTLKLTRKCQIIIFTFNKKSLTF